MAPRVLIVSRSAWDDTNSTGNTLTNLFRGAPSHSLANVYFRSAPPSNPVCDRYYQMSEALCLSGGGRAFVRGVSGCGAPTSNFQSVKLERSIVQFGRARTSSLPLLMQELFWAVPWWNSRRLHQFLEEFSPTVIFSPVFENPYVNRVVRRIVEATGAKLALFHADDYIFKYHACEDSIDRMFAAKVKESIVRSVESSSLNYCISEPMKRDYERYFGKQFDILRKGASWRIAPRQFTKRSQEVRLLYAGSLHQGRWNTLETLVRAIVSERIPMSLDIYCQYDVEPAIRQALEVNGVSKFHGAVSPAQLETAAEGADALLHVESFDPRHMKAVQYSFSTKIADALGSGRPLIAVGPRNVASIEYLLETGAALVATNETELGELLARLHSDKAAVAAVVERALGVCKMNHDRKRIQKSLWRELGSIASQIGTR